MGLRDVNCIAEACTVLQEQKPKFIQYSWTNHVKRPDLTAEAQHVSHASRPQNKGSNAPVESVQIKHIVLAFIPASFASHNYRE